MSEPVVSIDVNEPVGEILRLFAAYSFHHLPVVDKGKVIGMLSSADILKFEAFLPKRGGASADVFSQRLRVDQLMHQPPITVAGTQPVEQAAALMTKHGIHALPVTDSNDQLLGIITTTDIINAVLHAGQRGSSHSTATTEAENVSAPLEMSAATMGEAAQMAVTVADFADERGKLARALLHAQSRLKVLENVLACADRYVHGGQDQGLHRLLVKAITTAKSGGGTLRQRL